MSSNFNFLKAQKFSWASVLFGATLTSIISYTQAAAIYYSGALDGILTNNTNTSAVDSALLIALMIIFSPAIETLILRWGIQSIRRLIANDWAISIIAATAAMLLHMPVKSSWALIFAIFTAFYLFSHILILRMKFTNPTTAFVEVWIIHSIYNLLAMLPLIAYKLT